MSPDTDVAVRDAAQETIASIRGEAFQQQLALALPDNVTVGRFVRATVTALMENPDVAGADRTSLFQSVIRCAQDGLMPDAREAALVIFKGKVVYLPMIGGYRKIAAEYGWTLEAHVVYENDTFDYQLGLDARVEHRPARLGMDRGDRIGAYAVARHKDGRRLFEVLPEAEVEKARKVSRYSDRGPWVEWTDRMWEKTAGRRLFGRLPLAHEDRVVRFLNAEEISDPIGSLYGSPGARDGGETSRALGEGSPESHPANGGGTEDPPSPAADDEPEADTRTAASDSTPDDEPDIGEPAETDDEIQAAAIEAARVKVHFGKHKGKALGQIYEKGRSEGWFKWLLQTYDPENEDDLRVQHAGLAFCRWKLPEVYQEALAAEATR